MVLVRQCDAGAAVQSLTSDETVWVRRWDSTAGALRWYSGSGAAAVAVLWWWSQRHWRCSGPGSAVVTVTVRMRGGSGSGNSSIARATV